VTNKPARLTVYSRAWCHLCDELLDALKPLQAEFGAEVDVIDVDEHPGLEERYGERVPVLLAEGDELCHYHLDTDAVRAYLLNLR
jgi:glutaredoxin